jgi:hypothetical protein
LHHRLLSLPVEAIVKKINHLADLTLEIEILIDL